MADPRAERFTLLPLLVATFLLLLGMQENLGRHSSAQSKNYRGALFIK